MNLIILYVENTAHSTAFYERLLGNGPVEASPNFVMFKTSGPMLGLWARHDVEPATSASAGCMEWCLMAGSASDVDRIHADWRAKDIAILQPPVKKEFGYTFTACDPDGHRIRVLAPS